MEAKTWVRRVWNHQTPGAFEIAATGPSHEDDKDFIWPTCFNCEREITWKDLHGFKCGNDKCPALYCSDVECSNLCSFGSKECKSCEKQGRRQLPSMEKWFQRVEQAAKEGNIEARKTSLYIQKHIAEHYGVKLLYLEKSG